MPVVRLLLLLILGFLLSSCGSADDRPADEYVVASVNGEEITARWFRQTYFDFLVRSGANETRANRYVHLDGLIDALLLAEEARRRGFADDSLGRIDLERERKKALGGRFYEEELLRTLPDLTDREIRQAFARWKTQVSVRHLFYTNPDSAAAAHARLKAGRDFLEEAQDCYGTTEFDSLAGFLGPVRYFMIDDAFAEAAYSLNTGEFSEPVKSRFGYHIIRVEGVVRSALMTESEYQTRKGGIGKRARIRKTRLAGDQFVRELMEPLNIRVNTPAVRALALFLSEAERDPEARQVDVVEGEADPTLSDLLSTLDPGAPLATFTWDGEEETFTVSDYFFWLPTLPYAERRSRIAASVGRAIRNEVLAREGERRDLEDAQVRRSIRREASLHLGSRLLDELRADTTVRPTEDQLRTAFERFRLDRRELLVADFWMIPFASMAEATRAKNLVESGRRRPAAYEGFTEMTNVDLETQPAELRYFIRQAPPGKPVLVGLANDQWIVLSVGRREGRRPAFEESRPVLESRLRPYIAEYNLLAELRSSASIRVDTTRFEQVMEFLDAE